jgi:hypothetical protein
MGISSILIISLAAGVVLVVGGGVMMYMANLVRSAYEIKVQINNDVDERLTKMGDDLDKKSRWIKRDLVEEIDKIRMALVSENTKKFQEMSDPLIKRLDALEQMLRNERGEWVKAVDVDRHTMSEAEGRIKALRRDIKRIEDRLGMASSPESAAAPDHAAAAAAAKAAGAPPPEPAAAPPPAAKPAPPRPTGPVSVSSILQELGNG